MGTVLAGAVAAWCLACGETGTRETRPIEAIFHVGASAGTKFRVARLQGANADHRLDGAGPSFEAPHFFVLENVTQPISGIFENLDAVEPITVSLFLGTDLRRGPFEILAGETLTIGTGTPAPAVTGREVRFEVFSIRGATNVAFSATLGDQRATHATTCFIPPIAETCRTPATFFLERPRDSVSAVISKSPTEDPSAVLQVDLYVDGVRVQSRTGTRDVVVSRDL